MQEDRIIELEIKIAYQEDLIQELNKIVVQHQQQISRLEMACKLLNERIRSLSNVVNAEDSIDQPPPHY